MHTNYKDFHLEFSNLSQVSFSRNEKCQVFILPHNLFSLDKILSQITVRSYHLPLTQSSCITAVWLILLIYGKSITPPCALWNLISHLLLLLQRIYLPGFISNITNDKNAFWKTVKLASFQKPTINFNRLQVCPSMHTFVFLVLLIPLCNVLSDYF